MSVLLLPIGNDAPYMDENGAPLNGGSLYTYTANSSTPEPTYTTSLGNVQNANPITLNAAGYPEAGGNIVQVWGTAGVSYKFVLKDAAGATIWTRDNIMAINDTTVTIDQWVAGPAPTYISTTSFSLVGDQTSDFQVGRRVKSTNSGGTIYSTIKTSAYASVTTVTVVNDSSTLDSGLSAVFLGLLSATNPSTPLLTDAYPIVSGSSDKTKKVRLEVDGLTTDTTRVITVSDKDFAIGKNPTQQIFTSSSGTYTTASGATRLHIRMIGGGGGGGGSNTSGAAAGSTGGSTTFSTYTAAGGVGGGLGDGAAAAAGGSGGAASGGDINIAGGKGTGSGAPLDSCGGTGGSSAFGGCGGGGQPVSSNGTAGATNSGGGGGGGGGSSGTFGGGGGGSGAYVEAWINTPAGTYSYAVGALGAGGTGNGAANGGNGGSGIIIVEEFYN